MNDHFRLIAREVEKSLSRDVSFDYLRPLARREQQAIRKIYEVDPISGGGHVPFKRREEMDPHIFLGKSRELSKRAERRTRHNQVRDRGQFRSLGPNPITQPP